PSRRTSRPCICSSPTTTAGSPERMDRLGDTILERAGGTGRFIVGIAGPPGAGKSTLARTLCDRIAAAGVTVAVVPMDGFHLDDGLLEARGLLPRKGSPETFDVAGLRHL